MKAIFISLFLVSTALNADTLKFKLQNQVLENVDSKEWRSGHWDKEDKTTLKEIELTLFNVTTEKETTYIGYDFEQVMDHIYGKNWRNYKRIIFKAKDGFVRASLVKVVLNALKNNQKGLIAFKEKDKEGFSLIKKRKNLDPGDFYLVWTGFKKGDDLVENANTLIWPYQLKEIKVAN